MPQLWKPYGALCLYSECTHTSNGFSHACIPSHPPPLSFSSSPSPRGIPSSTHRPLSATSCPSASIISSDHLCHSSNPHILCVALRRPSPHHPHCARVHTHTYVSSSPHWHTPLVYTRPKNKSKVKLPLPARRVQSSPLNRDILLFTTQLVLLRTALCQPCIACASRMHTQLISSSFQINSMHCWNASRLHFKPARILLVYIRDVFHSCKHHVMQKSSFVPKMFSKREPSTSFQD